MPDAAREKAKKESRNADSSSVSRPRMSRAANCRPEPSSRRGGSGGTARGGCPRRRASANVKRDHAVFSQTSAT